MPFLKTKTYTLKKMALSALTNIVPVFAFASFLDFYDASFIMVYFTGVLSLMAATELAQRQLVPKLIANL